MRTLPSRGQVFSGTGIMFQALSKASDDINPNLNRSLLLYDREVPLGHLINFEWGGMIAIDCTGEPTFEQVDELMRHIKTMFNMRRGYTSIVALGGGSLIDMSKVISCLLTNKPNSTQAYYTGKRFEESSVPVIAVPTTLSGAEATSRAFMVHKELEERMELNDQRLLPRFAILDSERLADSGSGVYKNSLEGLRATTELLGDKVSEIDELVGFELQRKAFNNMSRLYQVALNSHLEDEPRAVTPTDAKISWVEGLKRLAFGVEKEKVRRKK